MPAINRSTSPQYDKVATLLSEISPDCPYDWWFRIAAAIYNTLGDDGFDLFNEWSSKAITKYPGRKKCWEKWCHCRTLSRISIGTLHHLARCQ